MQQLLLPKPQLSSPLLINPRVRIRVRVSVRVPVQVSSSSSSSSFSKQLATETELLPNALRRKTNPLWTPRGFTLGVDLGDSRTGLALGKGFSPRPLNVIITNSVNSRYLWLLIYYSVVLGIGPPWSEAGAATPGDCGKRGIRCCDSICCCFSSVLSRGD